MELTAYRGNGPERVAPATSAGWNLADPGPALQLADRQATGGRCAGRSPSSSGRARGQADPALAARATQAWRLPVRLRDVRAVRAAEPLGTRSFAAARPGTRASAEILQYLAWTEL